MKFYILNVDANAAHRYLVPGDYDRRAPNAQTSLIWEHLPDYEPIFSDLLIGEDYTDAFFLTDFLVDSGAIRGQGFLVSEKVKTVLQEFTLCPHRYYPLRSFRINEDAPPTPLTELRPDMQYYYLQLVAVPYYDWVDYTRSSFYVRNSRKRENRPLHLSNAEALREAIAQSGRGEYVHFEHLTLTEAYHSTSLDVFFLLDIGFNGGFNEVFMTERVQQALQQAGVTGMAFPEPVNITLPARLA
ncbi:hypothetical protein [Hymenobacter terrenus]|uniref:hypothetical protein n=1 Tax=Hymenobacter terrenus TaxID=1629124 RepID=UPI000619D581|nr:hypothetical protein [Hymenobacter terrenus]